MKSVFSFLFLFVIVLMAQCQGNKSTSATASINKNLPVAEYDQLLLKQNRAQLLDVRTPEEYKGGHLQNAVNADYNAADFESKVKHLDKSTPVFLYCLSGGRSSGAAGKLQQMGFAEVYNLDGGIMKWTSAGKPLEEAAGSQPSKGLTLEQYQHLTSQKEYVLVDFMASWCGPCKKMAPSLDRLAERKKDVLALQKIDADQNKQLLKDKQIDGIPYLELYHNGKLIWTQKGFIEEAEMLKQIKL